MPTKQIHTLRLDLDSLAQLTESLTHFPTKGSFAASNALRLSKAWLGQLLKHHGEASPYQNDGKRTTVEDIEPANDVSDFTQFDEGLTLIHKIDLLRQSIEPRIYELQLVETTSREEAICRTNAWNYATEAKMHLGFWLGGIRDSEGTAVTAPALEGEDVPIVVASSAIDEGLNESEDASKA